MAECTTAGRTLETASSFFIIFIYRAGLLDHQPNLGGEDKVAAAEEGSV